MGQRTEAQPGTEQLNGTPSRSSGRDTVWSCDVLSIHDALWSSRGIQAIRPGETVQRDGPVLYLLLRDRQLVEFDVGRVIKLLHWLNPRCLRLRIGRKSLEHHRERIVSTEDGSFVRAERRYGRRTSAHTQVWITGDASLARRWAAHETGIAAHEDFRASRPTIECAPARTEGSTHKADVREEADEWLQNAVASWGKPTSVFPEVYEYSPGVWAHETSTIDPSARIVAPVWIGEGARIPEGAVLIGPIIVRDAEPVNRGVPEIDWAEVKSPHWKLKPLRSGVKARLLAKRAFDIAFSLMVLAVTLPFYPLIMLLIYLEDGRPFFFLHRRQTLGGREFPCIKFRTMRKDAEEMKRKLASENASDGPQFHMKNDPRILKVGGFLRATHLDELPQFLNVLAGHMSVVGPRPSPDDENQFCPSWREARLSVRPGVTGLWQIKRTREPLTDFQEWIRYDLEYVQHQSFARDLAIIARTLGRLIGR